MKKVLGIALLSVLVGCIASAGGGKLTIAKHENGKTASTGYLLNDNLKVGDWVYFFESGGKEKEGRYVEDQMQGAWTFWHANGRKRGEGTFKKGKPDGVWTYWDGKGNFTMTETYKNGELLQ